MVRAFREFCSELKKRTTSGGCPQFSKRFSGKLPFHLTSNRNFRIFWLNGKHPKCLGLLRSQDLFGGAIVRHFESPRRKDPGNEVL